jgi:hypothetical protein
VIRFIPRLCDFFAGRIWLISVQLRAVFGTRRYCRRRGRPLGRLRRHRLGLRPRRAEIFDCRDNRLRDGHLPLGRRRFQLFLPVHD